MQELECDRRQFLVKDKDPYRVAGCKYGLQSHAEK